MGPATWRDLLRTRCRAIARLDTSEEGVARVQLCARWRWHRGDCSPIATPLVPLPRWGRPWL